MVFLCDTIKHPFPALSTLAIKQLREGLFNPCDMEQWGSYASIFRRAFSLPRSDGPGYISRNGPCVYCFSFSLECAFQLWTYDHFKNPFRGYLLRVDGWESPRIINGIFYSLVFCSFGSDWWLLSNVSVLRENGFLGRSWEKNFGDSCMEGLSVY